MLVLLGKNPFLSNCRFLISPDLALMDVQSDPRKTTFTEEATLRMEN